MFVAAPGNIVHYLVLSKYELCLLKFNSFVAGETPQKLKPLLLIKKQQLYAKLCFTCWQFADQESQKHKCRILIMCWPCSMTFINPLGINFNNKHKA